MGGSSFDQDGAEPNPGEPSGSVASSESEGATKVAGLTQLAPSVTQGEGSRPSRLVGSIVDPDVLEPLPRNEETSPPDHPVRARLLQRARPKTPESDSVSESEPLSTSVRAVPPAQLLSEALRAGPRFIEPSLISGRASGPDLSSGTPLPPTPLPPTPAPLPEAPSEPSLDSGEPSQPAGALHGSVEAEEVARELERVLGPSRPPGKSRGLSANQNALLLGLLGLTTLAALGTALSRMPLGSGPTDRGSLEGDSKTKSAPSPEVPAQPTAPRETRQKLPGPYRISSDQNKPLHKILSGTIGKDPFLKAIVDGGLSKGEAYRAYAALKDVRNLDRCGKSDQWKALVESKSGKLIAFEYLVSPEEVFQAKAEADGVLRGARLDLKVERHQVRRSLVMTNASLEESARLSGFDPGLAKVLEKSLLGHMTLSEFKPRDRVRVIVQEVTVLGDFSRYSGVEAVELLREGKPAIRFYYHAHPSHGGYFDENGRAPFEGGWRKPIPSAPVTSKFNMKRLHPVLKKVMPHNGTDFGAPTGTPIGATAPGKVIFIGDGGPSGNLVKISHDGGYESGYAHLSRYAEGLKVGDLVERLQTIGYCGSTGRSTGPHLHFTIRKDGAYIDAESLNLDGMRVLPPSERQAFSQTRAKYDEILSQIPLAELPPLSAPAPPPDAVEAGSEAEGGEPADPRDSPFLAEDGRASAPSGQSKPAELLPSPSGPKARAVSPSSIFLSDGDLLKAQPSQVDGEVDE